MSKLVWDQTGERLYETGVDKVVLYPYAEGGYGNGVAWNGCTQVSENPEGGEPTDIYADNSKYLTLYSVETLNLSIEAYTYPDEFAACNGEAELAAGIVAAQQSRGMFGLCYRTKVGNDEKGDALGYKLHLVYGCKASPSEKSYQTINDSPEAITFSFDVSSTPVAVEIEGKEFNNTSLITIDSTKVGEGVMAKVEAALYGTDPDGESAGTPATLPTPAQLLALIQG